MPTVAGCEVSVCAPYGLHGRVSDDPTGCVPATRSPKGSIVTPGCDVLAYRSSMRRLLASFVLALIGWGVLAPIALASVATKTPECCRRDGKHHCMSATSGMSGMSNPSANRSAFRSNSDACPHRFQASTPTSPAQIQPGMFSSLRQPTAKRHAEIDLVFCPSLRGQDNSQRGPPYFWL